MSCETHDFRVLTGSVLGGPTTNEEQLAWCRVCGALRSRLLTGWGISYPLADHQAPKVLAIPRVEAPAERTSTVRYGETCGLRTPDGPCTGRTTHALVSSCGTDLGRGCARCIVADEVAGEKVRHMEAPRATSARMDGRTLVLRLEDRRVIRVALEHLGPRLAAGEDAARSQVVLSARGIGVHWPALDEDLSVRGLLEGPHEGSR